MFHVCKLEHGDQRVGGGRVSGREVGDVLERAGAKHDVRFEVGIKERLSRGR